MVEWKRLPGGPCGSGTNPTWLLPPRDIKQCIDVMKRKGLKNSTINKKIGSMRSCFDHLVDGLEIVDQKSFSKRSKRLPEQVIDRGHSKRRDSSHFNLVKRRFLCRATGLGLVEVFLLHGRDAH